MPAALLPPALPGCCLPTRCLVRPLSATSPPALRSVKPLRWYIMTSPATDAETKKHFRSNGFFGLKESQAGAAGRAVHQRKVPQWKAGKPVLHDRGWCLQLLG